MIQKKLGVWKVTQKDGEIDIRIFDDADKILFEIFNIQHSQAKALSDALNLAAERAKSYRELEQESNGDRPI